MLIRLIRFEDYKFLELDENRHRVPNSVVSHIGKFVLFTDNNHDVLLIGNVSPTSLMIALYKKLPGLRQNPLHFAQQMAARYRGRITAAGDFDTLATIYWGNESLQCPNVPPVQRTKDFIVQQVENAVAGSRRNNI